MKLIFILLIINEVFVIATVITA